MEMYDYRYKYVIFLKIISLKSELEIIKKRFLNDLKKNTLFVSSPMKNMSNIETNQQIICIIMTIIIPKWFKIESKKANFADMDLFRKSFAFLHSSKSLDQTRDTFPIQST